MERQILLKLKKNSIWSNHTSQSNVTQNKRFPKRPRIHIHTRPQLAKASGKAVAANY